jgi:hypothetical protein
MPGTTPEPKQRTYDWLWLIRRGRVIAMMLQASTLLTHRRRATMTHAITWWQNRWIRNIESLLGHVAAVVIGFAMMVVGLALGVTMIMLPVGLVIGLVGLAMFVGGLFAHPNRAA